MTESTATTDTQVPRRTGRVTKTPLQMTVGRFMHNKMAIISLVFVLAIVIACVFAPLFTHYSATTQDLMSTDLPPGAGHLLGTDKFGVDNVARLLYGGRVDLLFAFLSAGMIMFIGVLVGGVAGYAGGLIDNVLMRIVDLMLNFPFLLFVIFIQGVFQINSIWVLIVAAGLTGWPPVSRLVRGMFLPLREQEFVLASKISGAGGLRIITRHMIPNVLGPLVVNATFLMATLIGFEAALAIIGFGVRPPAASWGTVLQNAEDFFTLMYRPWDWLPAALLITLTILAINFIGDGLRDAFDPSFEK